MDIEKQQQQQPQEEFNEKMAMEEEQDQPVVIQHRWMWVRRFIFCIIMITLFMQSLAPIYFENEEDIFIASSAPPTSDEFTALTNNNNNKAHIVLHTGFPPTEHLSGLPIYPGKAAATAFSPNPEGKNVKQIDMKHKTIEGGESWWDRLFPNRHVHLVSVQLPVMSINNKSNKVVEASLSICASKKQRFGLGRPQIPDMDNCIDTVVVHSDEEEDEEDNFGVLEWVPEVTIVLQKNKLYWLVVQTPSEVSFQWVYAQGGSNEYGTAYETEAGWEFKLDGEPIPSAMVMVEDHRKD